LVALLSPEDVASQCGLSRKAVYRAIERGELRASRLCSRLRIRPADVEKWIEASKVTYAGAAKSALQLASPSANGLRSLLDKSGS
jgi:excisionase family DNA binding protein